MHTPPRIVHLTTVHPLRDPRIFDRQVQTLRAAGYDVHLVARHARTETVDGVPVTALPGGRSRGHRVALLGRAYRAARALDADLYHFHDPELIPLAYALRRTTGARVVYDVHEDYGGRGGLEGRFLRHLERWCFTWVDHVVLASDSLLGVVEGTGVSHTLVPNYVRAPGAAAMPPTDGLPERVELLYAGVLAEERGLGMLLDVAARIRAEGLPWRLTLAGVCYRAADRAAAEARIAREGLASVVERVGWEAYLPWDAMPPLFRRAQVGLSLLRPTPPRAATLPTKFFEYLQYGLPIVTSEAPRWQAFVAAHGCGTTVPFGEAQAVVEAVRRWRADPSGYRQCAAAACRAAPRYRWDRVADRLLGLYDQLLGRPAPGLSG